MRGEVGRGERHTWSEVCREWEQIGWEKVLFAPATACSTAPRETHAHHPPSSWQPPVRVGWAGFPYDPSRWGQGDVNPHPSTKTACEHTHAHTTPPNQRSSPPVSPPQPREQGRVPGTPPATRTPRVPRPGDNRQHPPARRGFGGGGAEQRGRSRCRGRGGGPGAKQLVPGRGGSGCAPPGTRGRAGTGGCAGRWGGRPRGHTPAPGRRRGAGDAPGLGEGGDERRGLGGARIGDGAGDAPLLGEGDAGPGPGDALTEVDGLVALGALGCHGGGAERSRAVPSRAVPSRSPRSARPPPTGPAAAAARAGGGRGGAARRASARLGAAQPGPPR